jgi:NADH:ubiquinone oxidoreductase subunit C
MVAKILYTDNSKRTTDYGLGGNEHDENQAVRLVDYGGGVVLSYKAEKEINRHPTNEKPWSEDDWLEHRNLMDKIAEEQVNPVFRNRMMMASKRVNRKYEHIIVSFHENDRDKLSENISEEDKEEFVKRFTDNDFYGNPIRKDFYICMNLLDRLGFVRKDGEMPPYIITEHLGTDLKPHYHIFISRIFSDGKAQDTKSKRYVARKFCEEMERKYNLKFTGYNAIKEREINRDKIVFGEESIISDRKTNKHDMIRQEMALDCISCLRYSLDLDDFEEHLKKKNIFVKYRDHKNDKGETEHYGIIFTRDGYHFSGGDLDKKGRTLQYGNIEKQLAKNMKEAIELQNSRDIDDVMDRYINISKLLQETNTLYDDLKKQGITLSKKTSETYRQYTDCLNEIEYRKSQYKESLKTGKFSIAAGALLFAVNPILGILCLLFGGLSESLDEQQKKEELQQLYQMRNALRDEYVSLKEQRNEVFAEKNKKIEEYFTLKRQKEDISDVLDRLKKEQEAQRTKTAPKHRIIPTETVTQSQQKPEAKLQSERQFSPSPSTTAVPKSTTTPEPTYQEEDEYNFNISSKTMDEMREQQHSSGSGFDIQAEHQVNQEHQVHQIHQTVSQPQEPVVIDPPRQGEDYRVWFANNMMKAHLGNKSQGKVATIIPESVSTKLDMIRFDVKWGSNIRETVQMSLDKDCFIGKIGTVKVLQGDYIFGKGDITQQIAKIVKNSPIMRKALDRGRSRGIG